MPRLEHSIEARRLFYQKPPLFLSYFNVFVLSEQNLFCWLYPVGRLLRHFFLVNVREVPRATAAILSCGSEKSLFFLKKGTAMTKNLCAKQTGKSLVNPKSVSKKVRTAAHEATSGEEKSTRKEIPEESRGNSVKQPQKERCKQSDSRSVQMTKARIACKDEFYTQLGDIEKECDHCPATRFTQM